MTKEDTADAADAGPEELVLVERQPAQRTALVRLNRPKQLNALNAQVMDALCDALEELDRDDDVRAIVVTGDQRAFAAGADIGEMANATPMEMLRSNRIGQWDRQLVPRSANNFTCARTAFKPLPLDGRGGGERVTPG